MEEQEGQSEAATEKKSVWSTKANLIGVIVIIAMVAFIVGNRWGDIYSAISSPFRNTSNATLPDELDYSSVDELYDTLRRQFDGELNANELIDGMKRGLADAAGDPYTVYLNEQESQEFKAELNGTFTGIGAELGLENDRVVIVAPLEGFPAEAAGLRAGDVILAIDGDDAINVTIEEAVSRIRGEEGTDVTLTISRNGEVIDITITRAKIVVPSVKSEIREDGIGYLRISRFAEDTVRLAKDAANEFVAAGVTKVILDVRNDGGGYLDAAVDVSGLWLADGTTVVEQRSGDVVTQTLKTKGDGVLMGLKTIVLINKGSASASEIVAGALQDYKVATLVGQTSFGKGSVQSLEELSHGGVLKVTIARWYTPNGSNIDQEGIVPHVEVEITDEDYENDIDPQLNKAVEELNK